jgi:nitrile hydratase
MRYMVLPLRPEGTDGWSEERLAALVKRDSLIGVGMLPGQRNAQGSGTDE